MRAALLTMWLLAAGATAGFTVQVASTSSREEADRLTAVLAGRDVPAYVVAATVDGKPVYRVRAGSFPTKDAAKAYADSLPEDLKLQYWVAPQEEPQGDAKKKPVPAAIAGGADAKALLAEAIAAHGGPDGGFAALDRAAGVVLRYRLKSMDAKSGDAVFTHHVYSRHGKDLKLEIKPIGDEGESSVTVSGSDGAWVETAGTRTTLRAATARSRIEALGPAGMLRLPLAFPKKGAAAANIGGTVLAGERVLDGAPAIRLDARPAPAPYREASLYVDPVTKRLSAARFLTDAGELLLTFSDYREVAAGLVVPFKRSVYRDGTQISTVEIDDMVLE